MNILVIDNYDSFVYNLVQYVGDVVTGRDWENAGGTESDDKPGATGDGDIVVRRNDAVTLADIDTLDPDAIVVSPGPGTPQAAGISMPLFRERSYPTLGVCLGHQALCAVHDATVGHAESVVHGKPSAISHEGNGIFEGLPEAFDVGRYHSLAVERTELPAELVETAHTTDEESVVMGVRHREKPHVGVQFHPESILTDVGIHLVENFLRQHGDQTNATGGQDG